MTAPAIEDLLRGLAPQVLGALVRRHGQFDGCEDAVQEAVLAAAVQWPAEGVPGNPRGWLVTVASRRLTDQVRSDRARRQRESAMAAEAVPDDVPDTDDTLVLLFLCCHPALTAASQTALTLRAVGGLTTAEIARAFLVPEATMAARISRAKQRVKAAGSSFRLPPDGPEREERLRVVLHVLYLIFNEGYTASSGRELHRADLAREAIRLARMARAQLPGDGEVTGLLALMLLTHARGQARTTADGDLVPLAEQDRARWDRAMIDEGTGLVKESLAGPALGPYQLQAAIAATHASAATAGETNWPRVHALYLILERIAPNPMVTLNRAVALAETEGPLAGLALLAPLDGDERMAGHHRLLSVRAHLLERAGDPAGAYEHYRRAAKATASLAEQRYLQARASRLMTRGRASARSLTASVCPTWPGRPVTPHDHGGGVVERTTMGQKTVRFSDLSEQLIIDDSALVRIVVHEHPELDSQAVEIEAHLDEVRAITDAALEVAVVDLYVNGEPEPRRVTLDAVVFDKLAATRSMAELLTAARPAKRAPKPRAAATAADSERIDYSTLEHAGKPHKGKTTDAEKRLVREHLAEINERLAAEGLRTIDPADPGHVARYDLEDPAAGDPDSSLVLDPAGAGAGAHDHEGLVPGGGKARHTRANPS